MQNEIIIIVKDVNKPGGQKVDVLLKNLQNKVFYLKPYKIRAQQELNPTYQRRFLDSWQKNKLKKFRSVTFEKNSTFQRTSIIED